MQLGVKSGMIRSKLACRSGIDALKEYYGKVIEDKGIENHYWRNFLDKWSVATFILTQNGKPDLRKIAAYNLLKQNT